MRREAGGSVEDRVAGPAASAAARNGAARNGAAPMPLHLRSIAKHWPRMAEPVLAGVDLVVPPGTGLAICGRNGAGKTTLLRIAAGMIAPDSGIVRIGGIDPEADRTAFQRRVGFVSAGNTGLYARLRAEHHLEMWARLALLPANRRAPAIERVVDRFELAPLCGQRVDRLSMGQRQRLRLSLGFLHEPDVVFMDEPTNSLDDEGIALLGAAVDDLKARGGAAVACLPAHWEQLPGIDAGMVLAQGRLEPA
jgi:ABC-type multidrug transport system ATPase subunit